jgi:hypothetical protein
MEAIELARLTRPAVGDLPFMRVAGREHVLPNCCVSRTVQNGFDPYERNWH